MEKAHAAEQPELDALAEVCEARSVFEGTLVDDAAWANMLGTGEDDERGEAG